MDIETPRIWGSTKGGFGSGADGHESIFDAMDLRQVFNELFDFRPRFGDTLDFRVSCDAPLWFPLESTGQ